MTFPTTSATIARTDAAQTFTGAQTFSNAIIPSQTTGITGTTTNNNASTGYVGEYISSTVGNTTASLTTGVTANLTSLSLTAGDWDVSGSVQFDVGATTNITYWYSSISTTSATLGGNANSNNSTSPTAAGTVFGATAFTLQSPTVRISIASTTTVYLVTNVGFTISTVNAGGTIRARRVR
jgi:hypothetical protein